MDGLSVPSHGFKLICGTSNKGLSEEIARNLDLEPAKLTVSRFADGEIFVRIDENVRGNDVFIVQPTNPPADNIMELLLLIDAAKRASAARITCVMPYYGYARQDRKDQPRVPIGAKLMAKMINGAGVAPDVGSAKMARGFAKRLNATLAIIDKRRPQPNVSEVVNVVGDVEGH